jgi:hypothetical protein
MIPVNIALLSNLSRDQHIVSHNLDAGLGQSDGARGAFDPEVSGEARSSNPSQDLGCDKYVRAAREMRTQDRGDHRLSSFHHHGVHSALGEGPKEKCEIDSPLAVRRARESRDARGAQAVGAIGGRPFEARDDHWSTPLRALPQPSIGTSAQL